MGIASHASQFAPTADADGRTGLVGLSRQQVTDLLVEMGQKPFRARQVWHWIYKRGVTDFEAMTDINRDLRARLAEKFSISRPKITKSEASADGTHKWLLAMPDGQEIETVFIPESDRGTLCVSSQVGCTLTCRFCHTGTQRLVRNLTPGEIVGQLMVARDHLGDWTAGPGERRVTNIVMMGMGEPLYNFANVAQALHIVMDGEGLSLSRRRITLSTSGVVPMMQRCGEEIGVNLAVSLHAVTDALRDELVPLNRKYPLADLIAACRNYPGASNARRITFEYVMLAGLSFSLPERSVTPVGIVIGLINGVFSGLTGSYTVPGVMYLQALG
ncbi:MAG: 23S rRNA (adenine(2503)-C(2))-methyltransferase RlmN, partial [Pseudomonadota bacterium]